jgi:hypothetical protein
MSNVLTNSVALEFKSVEEAPIYTPETKAIKITRVIIVKNGMVSGKPSVDIQCEDADGNKYLIFATGGIMESIGAACK